MGRRPEGPAHPRKGGVFQTVKRTVTEFQEDNLTDWAAALTYYSVLSIFPALIALVSIVGLVGDPKTVTESLTDVVVDRAVVGGRHVQGTDRDVTSSKGSRASCSSSASRLRCGRRRATSVRSCVPRTRSTRSRRAGRSSSCGRFRCR